MIGIMGSNKLALHEWALHLSKEEGESVNNLSWNSCKISANPFSKFNQFNFS